MTETNREMKILLEEALQEFGDQFGWFGGNVEWNRCTAQQELLNTGTTLSGIRDALIGNGRILKEDTERQMYVKEMTLNGLFDRRALAVVVLRGENVEVIAYAHEGLIPQHTAEKAVGMLCDMLAKRIKH